MIALLHVSLFLRVAEEYSLPHVFTKETFLLVTAPNNTPQNVHIIQRDSCLILEWEAIVPEMLRDNTIESAIGYKLEWSQDNITQVTKERESCALYIRTRSV